MSRSPWHSMALQRRSARFFTCCAWLRVVWLYPTPLALLSSARCACRGRCLQSSDLWSAELTSTTCVPFCHCAWRSSRRHPVGSARAEGLSSPVGSLECGCDRDSRVLLWSVPAASFAASCRGPASCFGLRGALPPKLSRCDSSQLSPLRFAVCLVVSGHSSTQTCSNILTGSACLVELVTVEVSCSSRACAVPRSKHVQRSVRSLLANSPSARPCGRSFAPWAAHSELLLSLYCDSWL